MEVSSDIESVDPNRARLDATLEGDDTLRELYDWVDHPLKGEILLYMLDFEVDAEVQAVYDRWAAGERMTIGEVRPIANLVEFKDRLPEYALRMIAQVSRAQASSWNAINSGAAESSSIASQAHTYFSNMPGFQKPQEIEDDRRRLNRRRRLFGDEEDESASVAEISSSELPIDVVVRGVLRKVAHSAFNRNYNGSDLLGSGWHDRGASSVAMITVSVLLARMRGFAIEDVVRDLQNSLHGNSNFAVPVHMDIANVFREGSLMRELKRNGEPVGYPELPAEIGRKMFRSSRGVGKYVLEASRGYWGNGDIWAYDEDEESVRPETGLNLEDAKFMTFGGYALLALCRNFELFPSFDHADFIEIIANIDPTESERLLKGTFTAEIDELYEVFDLASTDQEELLFRVLETGHVDIVWEMYAKKGYKPIAALEIFRERVTAENFEFTQAIVDGNLSAEHLVLGIDSSGEAGIEQLKDMLRSVQQFVLSTDKTQEDIEAELEKIEISNIYREIWEKATRIKDAQFGEGADLEAIFRRFLSDSMQAPAPEYTPSGIIDIHERQSTSEVKLNREVEGVLKDTIDLIGLATEPEEAYQARVSKAKSKLELTLSNLEIDLRSKGYASKNRRKRDQERRKQLIYAASLLENALLEEPYSSALETVQLVKPARKLFAERVLRDYFATNHTAASIFKVKLKLAVREPDRAHADYIDIIGHELIQEFAGKGIGAKDVEMLNFLRNGVFKLGVVETDLKRSSAVRSDKTRPFSFTPNRDIGMELSGQIGDACWTDGAGRIASRHKHMTAVLIADHTKSNETPALVGSAMLIEAEDEQGEPILIVRGLNPIQNTITQLDAGHFLEEFLRYAGGIAKARGRKLALVYDHTSGASTNRPTLFAAMGLHLNVGQETDVKPISVDQDKVRFNGYGLEDAIYPVGV